MADEMAMTWPKSAQALIVAMVLAAGPALATTDDWVAASERLEYSRIIQSVNLALADQVRALPSPDLVRRSPEEARARLETWVTESRLVLAAQRFKLEDPSQYVMPDPAAAVEIDAQRRALGRFIDGLDILVEQFDYYSQSTRRLEVNADWCLDAYYDAQLLAIRVVRDLTASQSRLEVDPLVSRSLNVFAQSADIQILLALASHNRAHAAHLNALEWANNLSRSAEAMSQALDAANQALLTAPGDTEGWAEALAYEAQIVQETRAVAASLRNGPGLTLAGRTAGLDRLIQLYRNRPDRDMIFASSMVL
jgi:hypothetical protein